MEFAQEIGELQEDLVLYQVMLSSIEGEPGDAFEDERRERRIAIARIRIKIATLKYEALRKSRSSRLLLPDSVNE